MNSNWTKKMWYLKIFKSWILRETHYKLCECSYCKEFNGSCGMALPECKARNSWRIIWWRKNDKLEILRWTLPF